VLEHNGIDNRTVVLEDKRVKFHKILGQDSKVKQLTGLPEIWAWRLLAFHSDVSIDFYVFGSSFFHLFLAVYRPSMAIHLQPTARPSCQWPESRRT
jgi:hypothetical protein